MRFSLRLSPFVAAIMLVGIFLSSCATPKMPELKKVSHFKINRNNDDRKLQFEMDLNVFNPNRYKVKILDYNFDVFVNGHKVGNAFSDEKVVLKKEETGKLQMQVFTDLGKIAKGFLGLLKTFFGGDQKIDIGLDGYIQAKARGIRKKIRVKKNQPYTLKL